MFLDLISCCQFHLGFAIHLQNLLMNVTVYAFVFVLTCVFVHECKLFEM